MEEKNDFLDTVPAQHSGSQMDAVEKRKVNTESEALALFESACLRLLSVNDWGNYAGISAFQLIDSRGVRAERKAAVNDYIRIDIPGPGTHIGMGYDWVSIEDIVQVNDEKTQLLSMTVRPCAHPVSKTDEIAHFFKSEATSTFMIKRIGLCVSAEEHGRNEIPNTSDGSFYDKSRNFMVGLAAKLGLSYPQWKNLVNGLLKD
ncbi:hypothetical protein EZ456_14425 [Pedobacter psychrodurus]|uniref:Uncharacterized protein n=1 Tax=Pedobacter psychrodurus TaxID=2530456 RepID=A0A4V6N6J3_9SPHI|nr:hypothetical protein [Pedobacter psychrodurus]TCD26205.1 hypothetical protein EZ456_14425 [Pedobacter psychrodurus]